MRANETAMHYIALVYTMYLFQNSFVSLSRIKISTILASCNHSKNYVSFLVAPFNAVLFCAGTYWNVTTALSGPYIIGHYNSLQSELRPSFLTPLMLGALILYMSGGTCSLNTTLNYRFLRSFFLAILFSFCRKSAEKKSLKKYFHVFVLMSDLGF